MVGSPFYPHGRNQQTSYLRNASAVSLSIDAYSTDNDDIFATLFSEPQNRQTKSVAKPKISLDDSRRPNLLIPRTTNPNLLIPHTNPNLLIGSAHLNIPYVNNPNILIPQTTNPTLLSPTITLNNRPIIESQDLLDGILSENSNSYNTYSVTEHSSTNSSSHKYVSTLPSQEFKIRERIGNETIMEDQLSFVSGSRNSFAPQKIIEQSSTIRSKVTFADKRLQLLEEPSTDEPDESMEEIGSHGSPSSLELSDAFANYNDESLSDPGDRVDAYSGFEAPSLRRLDSPTGEESYEGHTAEIASVGPKDGYRTRMKPFIAEMMRRTNKLRNERANQREELAREGGMVDVFLRIYLPSESKRDVNVQIQKKKSRKLLGAKKKFEYPIHRAVKLNDAQLVSALLSRGAQKQLVDWKGETALMAYKRLAASKRMNQEIEVLLTQTFQRKESMPDDQDSLDTEEF